MSRARQLADVISGGFDVPAASLDNAVQTAGQVHAFKRVNGRLTYYTGADVTALKDANQNDLYDLVIVGTDDQTFSVNAAGHLILTQS